VPGIHKDGFGSRQMIVLIEVESSCKKYVF